MDDGTDLYPGGFAGLLRQQEKRQRRFDRIEDVLPAPDIDLAPLFEAVTPPRPLSHKDATRFSAEKKWLELQAEFEGQPQILHLHAMLIAVARRDTPPEAAITLFHRIWSEHGTDLVKLLNTRWRISAATTFADIGPTGDARAAGMALSIMFDMVKLHDSERRISGQPGRTPFRPLAGRKRFPLAFGLDPYSFKGGDLDRIMLARIWQLCEREPAIQPLGFAMLRQVLREPRSIFGRVQTIKNDAREARNG